MKPKRKPRALDQYAHYAKLPNNRVRLWSPVPCDSCGDTCEDSDSTQITALVFAIETAGITHRSRAETVGTRKYSDLLKQNVCQRCYSNAEAAAEYVE